jgi:hypothetical protein
VIFVDTGSIAKGLNAWAAYIESLVKQEQPLRVVSIQSTRKRMRRE